MNNQADTPLPFNTFLLLRDSNDNFIVAMVEDSKYHWITPMAIGGYDWECDVQFENITHWMELPTP